MYLTVCSSRLFNLGECVLAAKNQKSATKKTPSDVKVTRITASSNTKAKTKKDVAVKKEEKAKTSPKSEEVTVGVRNPFKAIGGYFAGAWYELKQVRWPNRKATWGLTVAVLAFSAFFVVLILLLDALFKYIFQLILG
jgi:preprotein translocase SecE subunit